MAKLALAFSFAIIALQTVMHAQNVTLNIPNVLTRTGPSAVQVTVQWDLLKAITRLQLRVAHVKMVFMEKHVNNTATTIVYNVTKQVVAVKNAWKGNTVLTAKKRVLRIAETKHVALKKASAMIVKLDIMETDAV